VPALVYAFLRTCEARLAITTEALRRFFKARTLRLLLRERCRRAGCEFHLATLPGEDVTGISVSLFTSSFLLVLIEDKRREQVLNVVL
jgi:hypothetical protein